MMANWSPPIVEVRVIAASRAIVLLTWTKPLQCMLSHPVCRYASLCKTFVGPNRLNLIVCYYLEFITVAFYEYTSQETRRYFYILLKSLKNPFTIFVWAKSPMTLFTLNAVMTPGHTNLCADC